GNLKGKKVGVLGVSFKPNTNDTRESPSLRLIEELISKEAKVVACDPKAIASEINVNREVSKCLEKVDAVILATEWEDYKKLNAKDFKKYGVKLVIDTRRVYCKEEFYKQGIKLIQLGRAN
ncbi:MAG: UDP binding domain-containing protein, partial [Thermoproteota archaeon]